MAPLWIVMLFLLGCARDTTAPASIDSTPTAAAWQPTFQFPPIATYDRSGQAVHPDAVTWLGNVLVAATPYPFGNGTFERPSVFEHRGDSLVAVGANPVVNIAPGGIGLLSDPDLVADGDELRLYFRSTRYTGRNSWDSLYVIRWTDPQRSWSTPLGIAGGAPGALLSPAVVRTPDAWLMWTVGAGDCGSAAGPIVRRHSTDGLQWSAPENVQLQLPENRTPWHIDVTHGPDGQFWALVVAQKAYHGCKGPVYLARSQDGLVWDVGRRPLADAGIAAPFALFVYRGSLRPLAGDSVEVWLSGARLNTNPDGFRWSIGAARATFTELWSAVH